MAKLRVKIDRSQKKVGKRERDRETDKTDRQTARERD